MNILLATPIYPPEIGGPATYTKELVFRLHKKHKLTVVAYTNEKEAFEGSVLIPINKNSLMPVRLFKFFIAVLTEAKKADVIYVQNAMAAGLPVMLAGVIRCKPVILKFVGDEAWERASQSGKTKKRLVDFLKKPDAGFKAMLRQFVQGLTLRNVSIVTTPSQYLGEAIREAYRIPKNRVHTNYNAADISHNQGEKKESFQVCSTSRLVAWKKVDQIILAIDSLKEKIPNIHLCVAGDGPERRSLEKLVAEKNISKHVTFLGDVSKQKVLDILKNSSIFVLNSTYEGLPHGVLEAFGAKTPVIATDIPGTNEVVLHEKTGLCIPTDSPEAIALAIERLFSDSDIREKITSGGFESLKKQFSWENHLNVLEDFFETVTEKPSKGSKK